MKTKKVTAKTKFQNFWSKILKILENMIFSIFKGFSLFSKKIMISKKFKNFQNSQNFRKCSTKKFEILFLL